MSTLLSEDRYDSSAAFPRLLSETVHPGAPGFELHRLQRVRVYDAGEAVLSQSDGAGMFGKVVDGILKVVKAQPDGREQIVGLLFPGMTFGRLSSKENPVALEAATRATFCYIRHPRMDRLLAENSELQDAFLRTTVEALDAARDWMAVLSSQTIVQRLSTFLVMLVGRTSPDGFRDGSPLLSVPISRADLSAYLGTAHETLSRAVHALDRDGVIRIVDPHHFEILDLRRLRQLADGDRS